ncbi:siderophore-interacting protein [Corynebacterium macginleyi]|uniref:siderophore-interacting protein n=1 Tax=Corynebacterium macginleyi TaxID=38290 RepID=UPI00190DE825|nr:siderophore-interacting protein [Corynebacterium macginleyi]MBK4152429.1 SIP domain-containing protein [Corynebacterium macginleyi]MBK4156069.1 SIP domain-containing protein [Corynebacterium macginleyi]MBK4160833.1 SIP domain-containing protein [Corynebacterium macginleyi]MBK4162714.1 SIP domain-containing protein [Corynebacterium macginleyi]MBK4183219.1 SIP domain-containing protein [Corynebacterium macginleyi]
MPRNSRNKEIYPISYRELYVEIVEDISPAMRRITFSGEQLQEHDRDGIFVPSLVSNGFDDDVRLIFPDPETGERPHPIAQDNGNLLWPETVKNLFRTYTVRHFDAVGGQLVIDFARHGEGLAENWSQNARIGDAIFVAGPKSCAQLPTHTDWLFLAGDETALPAIGRCLESLPTGHKAIAVIEVPTTADIQNLEISDSVQIHWAIRDQGEDFVEKTCGLFEQPANSLLPGGEAYVWAAGEASRLKPLRRLFKACGIAPEHQEITGYWRRTSRKDGTESATSSSNSVLHTIHDLAELNSSFALRTAVRLGLFQEIDAGANTVSALAAATDLHEEALRRFVRYLAALKLVEISESTLALTAMGMELADPDSTVVRWLSGPAHIEAMALMRLEHSLRTGESAPQGERGLPWSEYVSRDPQLAAERSEQKNVSAGWTAPSAAQALRQHLDDTARVLIIGQGGAVYADEILRRCEQVQSRIITDASSETVLREIAASSRERCETSGDGSSFYSTETDYAWATDVVFIDPWSVLGGKEVAAQIGRAMRGERFCRAYILSEVLEETGGDEHSYEEDMVRLSMFGTKVPTQEDIGAAVADSGALISSATAVGWGKHLFVLEAETNS